MRLEEFIPDAKTLELIERAREFARGFFEREGTHGFSHVERVFNLCMHIGREEGADLEVLALASLLHDIARPLEDAGRVEDHAVEGAKIAKRFLLSLRRRRQKRWLTQSRPTAFQGVLNRERLKPRYSATRTSSTR